MSADTTSVFYQVGQAVAQQISNSAFDTSVANTFTGTQTFANIIISTGNTIQLTDHTDNGVVYSDADGKLRTEAGFTYDASTDTLSVSNLSVTGTTTSVQTTNTEIQDNLIVINEGANDSATEAKDGGFLFERASGTQNGAFLFEESEDRFEVGLTSGTGDAVSLGNVSLGALAVNSLLIGTRASTQALGDYADFTAGLNA